MLSKFGPILEAKIPHVAVHGIEGRRGFGFVTFACAEDAEKAVKNEIPLRIRGREVAVDICMGRKEYQEERKKHSEDDLNKGKAENSGEIEHKTTSFGEESASVPGKVPSSDITVKGKDSCVSKNISCRYNDPQFFHQKQSFLSKTIYRY